MPNISANLATSLPLPATLLPTAPATAEGGDAAFAAVIAGVTGDAMMLDQVPTLPSAPPPDIPVLPTLPVTGNDLPPALPEVAATPEPAPADPVEEVMIGSGFDSGPMADKPRFRSVEKPVANLPVDTAPVVATPKALPQTLPLLKALALRTATAPKACASATSEPAEDVAPDTTPRNLEPVVLTIALPLAPPLQAPQVPTTAEGGTTLPKATPADEHPSEPEASAAGPVVMMPVGRRPSAPRLALPQVAPPAPAGQPARPMTPLPEPNATAQQPVAPPTSPRPEPSFAPQLARQIAAVVREALGEAPAREAAPSITAAVEAEPAIGQAIPNAPIFTQTHQTHALRGPVVDTGRAEWMQAMIDQIGTIAQADGRREAQIRLLPSNLGPVEVKIVARDEQMHVTLHADSAQTRQLLSDAAPRLQELADARGLKLTQPSVGGGQSQDRRQAPEQHQQTPLSPRSAQAEGDSEPQPDGDLIA